MAETVLNFSNALDLNSLAQLLETDEILIELEDDLECLEEGNIKDLKVSEDSTSRKCKICKKLFKAITGLKKYTNVYHPGPLLTFDQMILGQLITTAKNKLSENLCYKESARNSLKLYHFYNEGRTGRLKEGYSSVLYLDQWNFQEPSI